VLNDDSRTHLEKYWQFGVARFRADDFALAAFFAITLIEEVGKVVILGNASLGAELDEKGFYNHPAKYGIAPYTWNCEDLMLLYPRRRLKEGMPCCWSALQVRSMLKSRGIYGRRSEGMAKDSCRDRYIQNSLFIA
jgi:AbiV family abortive infection protein